MNRSFLLAASSLLIVMPASAQFNIGPPSISNPIVDPSITSTNSPLLVQTSGGGGSVITTKIASPIVSAQPENVSSDAPSIQDNSVDETTATAVAGDNNVLNNSNSNDNINSSSSNANNNSNSSSINNVNELTYIPEAAVAPLLNGGTSGRIGEVEVPLPSLSLSAFGSGGSSSSFNRNDYGMTFGVNIPLGAGQFRKAANNEIIIQELKIKELSAKVRILQNQLGL